MLETLCGLLFEMNQAQASKRTAVDSDGNLFEMLEKVRKRTPNTTPVIPNPVPQIVPKYPTYGDGPHTIPLTAPCDKWIIGRTDHELHLSSGNLSSLTTQYQGSFSGSGNQQ